MNRGEIKQKAKEFAFSNKMNIWIVIIIIGVISSIISGVLGLISPTQVCKNTEFLGVATQTCTSTTYGTAVSLIESIVAGILGVASALYMLRLVRENKAPEIMECVKTAFSKWQTILIVVILYTLNVAIGFILFIVPGIMAALGLAFYTMVINDNPDLSAKEVLQKTWDLTLGYKMDYFIFGLSFLPWILLCIFVIPVIWVVPYIQTANVMYYEKLVELKNGDK